MNTVILMGRLTRDPDVRYTQGQNSLCTARFTLAVDRGIRRDSESNAQTADFPSCVAFRKTAEFIEKYCRKGTKLVVQGRIQTGSYTNREGVKVYTTDVNVTHAEFAESKAAASQYADNTQQAQADPTPTEAQQEDENGFMDIPDGISEELPFI